jgi:hypothetical protein
MFTGTGEMLGQIAHFEPFDDHGEKINLGNRPGQRRATRLSPPWVARPIMIALPSPLILRTP